MICGYMNNKIIKSDQLDTFIYSLLRAEISQTPAKKFQETTSHFFKTGLEPRPECKIS